jgi:processing peptidase subunit beta
MCEQMVEAAFASLPSAPASGQAIVRPPFAYTGSDVRVRYDDAPSAHIAYAFPTTGYADPDSTPLQVATALLGSWTFPNYPTFQSQMLMDVVFDEGGTEATHVSAFHSQYSDTGLFGVYAETPDQVCYVAAPMCVA